MSPSSLHSFIRIITSLILLLTVRRPGGKEKEWTDCVAEDRRVFGITGAGLEHRRT